MGLSADDFDPQPINSMHARHTAGREVPGRQAGTTDLSAFMDPHQTPYGTTTADEAAQQTLPLPVYSFEGLSVLQGAGSVHIGRVDLLPGQSQLQNFNILRPVKYLPGQKPLDQNADSAKRDPRHCRDCQKQAGKEKDFDHD